ncbi:MAG: M56 family metallopeptidase [Planctomycetes bacterium]|nr:M56 family metallopeptidase [Planctomycetota bacterium]
MNAADLSRLEALSVPALEWLGTYALHSTVVLAVTWLVARAMRGRGLGLQDALLRQALWLPLLSSTVQLAVVGSFWSLAGAAPALELATVDVVATEPTFALAPALTAAPAVFPEPASAPLPKALIAMAAVGLASLVGVGCLVRMWWRLRRVLATRRPETDGRVLAIAAQMAGELGLRQSPMVSTAAAIDTPIAFGMLRPEVCLPARAAQLDEESLRAMLTHELAHLRRGDAAWMWAAAWLQAMFPWQLMLLPVRRLWGRVVELRCDAEAAQRTSPTAVARCLIEVAEWLRPQPRTAIALGMAARPSALRERVEAVLERADAPHPARALAFSAALLSLTTMTVAAPGLRPQPVEALLAVDELELEREVFEVDDVERLVDMAEGADEQQALRELLPVVEQEYGLMMREADGLRAELLARATPRALRLQAALQSRLENLTRLRARLIALVAGDVPGIR